MRYGTSPFPGLPKQDWDRRLHIRTCGRDESGADDNRFPYEPTPYPVLERLSESEYIGNGSHVLDYGCGKGRVCFFLASACGCRATGIDFSEKMIQKSQANRNDYPWKNRVRFLCCPAEQYELQDEDVIFFFNPFTERTLRAVLGQVRKSWFRNNRPIRLFCYYPSDEFVSCLMTASDVEFLDEIDCRDLFEGNNPRERILIFEMMTRL